MRKQLSLLVIVLATIVPVFPVASHEPEPTPDPSFAKFGLDLAVASAPKDHASFNAQIFPDNPFDDFYGAMVGTAIAGSFAEVYVGPTFKVMRWLKLGIGGGFAYFGENLHPVDPRFVFLGLASTGKFSVLQIVERGLEADFWHKTEINLRINSLLGAGALVQANAGVGPRIELAIPAPPFSVYGAPLYHWQDKSFAGIFGIRLMGF